MNYTEDVLLDLIERHDEHEEFYRQKLAELRTPTAEQHAAPTRRAPRLKRGERIALQITTIAVGAFAIWVVLQLWGAQERAAELDDCMQTRSVLACVE